ncbi:MAG: hypothetical protein KDJ30_05215, partial [Rhodoblastus sp.]|nr:hypothetical protein [Rhodoblastus sp.]
MVDMRDNREIADVFDGVAGHAPRDSSAGRRREGAAEISLTIPPGLNESHAKALNRLYLFHGAVAIRPNFTSPVVGEEHHTVRIASKILPVRGFRRSCLRARSALTRAFSIAGPKGLDAELEARLRAAQIAVIARHTPAMIVVNLISGLMLVAALSLQGPAYAPAAWFAALAAVCAPVAFRVYRRRHK